MADPDDVRKARLFKNAGNLAVRLPVDWHIDAEEAELRYDGISITVTPLPRTQSLSELLEEFAADPITDDWGDDPADQPQPKPVAL